MIEKINKGLILEFFDELIDHVDGKTAAIAGAGAGGLAIGGAAALTAGAQPDRQKPLNNNVGSIRSNDRTRRSTRSPYGH